MATKIHHLNPIQGTQEIFTILEVLSNKDKFAKALSEIETKRKEVNDLIEVVGDAEEIKTLHAHAKAEAIRAEQFAGQKVLESNKEFAKAHERSEKLVNDATEKANSILKEAKFREDDLARRIDEFNRTSSDQRNDLSSRLAEVTNKETELRQRESKAQSMIEEGTRLKNIYEEKIEKIRKLQGEL